MKIEQEKDWERAIMVHDWPESGPDSLEIEHMYQIFKQRLVKEICTELYTLKVNEWFDPEG